MEFKNAAAMISECRNTNRRTNAMGSTTADKEFDFMWNMLDKFSCCTVEPGIVDDSHCLVSESFAELSQIITYLEEYERKNAEFSIRVYTNGKYALFCRT